MAWSGWWRWGAATLVVLLLAVPTAVAWFGVGPERAASVATILALLAIAGSVFRWAQRSSRGTAISTPAQIDEAARTLATLVEQQWRHEVRIRLLTDPAPLTVQWKAADPELGDHHWLAGTLSGRTDDVSQLIEAFRRLPQPRLVILGGPGAGKTTLAVLLTLALCDRPSDRDPVPVLLAPGSWDPATEHLHTWIKRRLGEDYPALRATVFGPTAIEGLVAGLRVLPVVDGLDELPESSARDALVRICQALADRDPLIVTCRTEEYRSMVAASDVITAAAVIEAQKVDPGDVVAYLEMVVPPGGRSQRWQPVFDHLRVHRHRNGPLATALSTPLMVSLLRNVYANAPADPAELVNPHRFPDRASIESHLLNALIPTSIALTRPEPAWRARAWDVEASQRWLSFLATHLNRLGTRDLRWWHLYRHLPTRVWRLVLGLVFGLGLGLVFVLGLGLLFGLLFGLGLGLGFGLLFGLVVGIEAGPKALGAEPARASWRLRGRVRSLIARLGVGVGLGLASGLVFGLPGGLALELPGGLVSALGFGLVAGLLGGLTTWLRVPSSDDRGATPLSTIDGTRTLVLAVATCAVALVFGLGVALMFGLGVVFALWFGLVFGLGMGLVVGFAVGVMSDLLPGAWVPFVIVRLWLALRRQLPWRLIAFLEDCHRLGILRQVGPVYQFRHARLQDHLARPLTNPSASAHTHTP